MSTALQVIALLLFVLGLLLLLAAYRIGRMLRPTGHVEYVDGQVEAYVPHGPLISTSEGLAGQPHGLLRLVGKQQMVPVQVLDAPAPAVLDPSTRLQVAAFCLLAEVVYDQAVPYALLRYTDRDVPVNWTPSLARDLSQNMAAMRHAAVASDVPRSHHDPAICHTCAVRLRCDQALE